jgi:hypothetical protein
LGGPGPTGATVHRVPGAAGVGVEARLGECASGRAVGRRLAREQAGAFGDGGCLYPGLPCCSSARGPLASTSHRPTKTPGPAMRPHHCGVEFAQDVGTISGLVLPWPSSRSTSSSRSVKPNRWAAVGSSCWTGSAWVLWSMRARRARSWIALISGTCSTARPAAVDSTVAAAAPPPCGAASSASAWRQRAYPARCR